jgi:hypothetical protein
MLNKLALEKSSNNQLSARTQDGIADARQDKDGRQIEVAIISDLVCDGKNDAGQQEMQKRRALPIRKLEEGDHQTNKACHSQNIEKGRHEMLPILKPSLALGPTGSSPALA